MLVPDSTNPFNTYMNMVTAIAVTGGLVMGYIRDRRLAKSNANVATAVSEVAVKAKEVAVQADKAAVAVEGVKTELSTSTSQVTGHLNDIEVKVSSTAKKVDATHVIVNAQKTAMMKKLADSQMFTLTLAEAMLEEKPNNKKLKAAVVAAKALYDQSMKDLEQKEEE